MFSFIKALFLALILYSTASFGGEWRDFSLESAPGFTVQVVAKGKVKIDDECICINVESAKLFRPAGVGDTAKVIGVVVGLASLIDPPTAAGDTWQEFAVSMNPVLLPVLLGPDGEVELAPFERRIKLDGKEVPKDVWVMLSVAAGDIDSYGVSYAHEPGTPTR